MAAGVAAGATGELDPSPGEDLAVDQVDPAVRWGVAVGLDVAVGSAFATRGVTELGFLSVTLSKEVAMAKAAAAAMPGGLPPAVLQLSSGPTDEPASRGANISAFSLSPLELEVVYLPGALLRLQSAVGEQGDEQAGAEGEINVVDVQLTPGL